VYLYLHQIFVSLKLVVKNLNETITFSRKLANCCAQLKSSFVIYLIGELGVGKTALAQGFIQYFGFEQVKSPTYSLVVFVSREL